MAGTYAPTVPKEIGQVAYEAFCATKGDACLMWRMLGANTQNAWRAAARACVEHTAGSGPATVPELADDGDDQ